MIMKLPFMFTYNLTALQFGELEPEIS